MEILTLPGGVDRRVPRAQPLTIWAVRGLPEREERTFFNAEHVRLDSALIPLKSREYVTARAATHFVEYPGALRLVGMSKEEEALAVEIDAKAKGSEKVLFSWRRLPGVLD